MTAVYQLHRGAASKCQRAGLWLASGGGRRADRGRAPLPSGCAGCSPSAHEEGLPPRAAVTPPRPHGATGTRAKARPGHGRRAGPALFCQSRLEATGPPRLPCGDPEAQPAGGPSVVPRQVGGAGHSGAPAPGGAHVASAQGCAGPGRRPVPRASSDLRAPRPLAGLETPPRPPEGGVWDVGRLASRPGPAAPMGPAPPTPCPRACVPRLAPTGLRPPLRSHGAHAPHSAPTGHMPPTPRPRARAPRLAASAGALLSPRSPRCAQGPAGSGSVPQPWIPGLARRLVSTPGRSAQSGQMAACALRPAPCVRPGARRHACCGIPAWALRDVGVGITGHRRGHYGTSVLRAPHRAQSGSTPLLRGVGGLVTRGPLGKRPWRGAKPGPGGAGLDKPPGVLLREAAAFAGWTQGAPAAEASYGTQASSLEVRLPDLPSPDLGDLSPVSSKASQVSSRGREALPACWVLLLLPGAGGRELVPESPGRRRRQQRRQQRERLARVMSSDTLSPLVNQDLGTTSSVCSAANNKTMKNLLHPEWLCFLWKRQPPAGRPRWLEGGHASKPSRAARPRQTPLSPEPTSRPTHGARNATCRSQGEVLLEGWAERGAPMACRVAT
ncbi:translation initiation factor IF-2-like [Dipodomys spectabilis]|uniref:translation initiation factor IF-2-like n=1 Tax=Dipodomys spectabilis TaxID=105255 RepID=UPI001C538B1C|nr:translation initiation factor IF-2-like [Dipodomys spectabilis]